MATNRRTLLKGLACAAVAPLANSLGAAESAKRPFLHIAVWLQSPHNAERYKAAGINTYVALWQGPTDAQLDALKAAGIKVVCDQNAVGLARKDDPTILAWMHGDEPDNAQSKPGGGFGPPIPPEKIVADYERLKKADPSRPVLLNLGQGVAWDGWYGRGVRTNHREDYPEYVKGSDIVSFDIYPAVHDNAAVAGNLQFVGDGVKRLKSWAGPDRTVWNCIEASRIDNAKVKPTAAQIKAEVWMSLIHGSRGLIYFVHQFKPRFIEASLLEDAELLKAVTAINREVTDLADVILSPEVKPLATVEPESPLAITTRRAGGIRYVFAVAMRNKPAEAKFTVSGPDDGTVEVIGEGRTLPLREEVFRDRFDGYGVHLYRIR